VALIKVAIMADMKRRFSVTFCRNWNAAPDKGSEPAAQVRDPIGRFQGQQLNRRTRRKQLTSASCSRSRSIDIGEQMKF
jgi:hypothetical protein